MHVLEGHLDNARYWYGRAPQVFSDNSVREWAALRERCSPCSDTAMRRPVFITVSPYTVQTVPNLNRVIVFCVQ